VMIIGLDLYSAICRVLDKLARESE